MLTKEAIIEKYPNGQIEWHIPIEWYTLGKYRKHGVSKQFYRDGKLKIERNYVHGLAVGSEKIYYPDGAIMSELPFDNKGQRDGKYVYYHRDGSTETVDYEAGEPKGKPQRFDRRGREIKKRDAGADKRGEPGPKKIMPGDNVPASVLRRSALQ